jgi:hypothetical protein
MPELTPHHARLIRTVFSLILAFAAFGSLLAAAPESMKFGGVTFRKAFSDKTAEGPFSEYLPKGQSLETWSKLMGWYEFPALNSPKEVGQTLVQVVKKQNPDAQGEVVYNSTLDEAIVDFVTWPKDQSYVEFNVWKYTKAHAGGLVAIQYAERVTSDFEAFFKKLGDKRTSVRNEMATYKP